MADMTKAVGVGAVTLGMLVGSAGVAHADDRSYLDRLAANGMTYGTPLVGLATPAVAVNAGNAVCANIRYGSEPRAGFNTLTNMSVPDYLIDAAQHELCPDTL